MPANATPSNPAGKKRKHHEPSSHGSSKSHRREDEDRRKTSSSSSSSSSSGSSIAKDAKDPKLHQRICRYLTDNRDKQYIDIEEMSRKLHEAHEEYNRKKLKIFRLVCEAAFEHINMENPDVGAESNDEAAVEPKEKPEDVKGSSTNKMMSNLYGSKKDGGKKEASKGGTAGNDVKRASNGKKRGASPAVVDIDGPEVVEVKGAAANKKTTIDEAKKQEEPGGGDGTKGPTKHDGGAKDAGKPEVLDSASASKAKGAVSVAAAAAAAASSTPKKVPARRAARQIEVVESNVTFKDVGGMNRTLVQVCKLMIHLKHPEVFRKVGVTPPRGFLLHGPPGCGKTLLANAIAGQMQLPLIKLAATEIVSGVSGESESRLRDLFDQAMATAPCILFIDEIDAITQRRETAQKGMEGRIVGQLLACMDGLNEKGNDKEGQVVVIGATNRPDSLDPALRRAGRFEREIAMGIPDEKARRDILQVLTSPLNLEPDFDLAKLSRLCPGFVGADLSSLCREAAIAAVNRAFTSTDDLPELLAWLDRTEPLSDEALSGVRVEMSDFDSALRLVQPSAKREGFATAPDVTWDDVGALDHVREELELSILAPVNHPEATKALGMESPTGILLCGPPGCGKTLLAKAVANEAGINFISVKGPELLNMYVGESERAVRQVFQRAKNSAPCVIFFDELDALCPRRSATSGSGDSSARVVNQLLTEMDGMESRRGVFVMAATNRVDIIDPAVLRPGRLQKILFVDLPSAQDRVAILGAITKNGRKPNMAPDVDFAQLASSPSCQAFSGADMSALVTEASVAAFKEHLDRIKAGHSNEEIRVSSRHFDQAFAKVRPSVSAKDRKRYSAMRNQYASSAVRAVDVRATVPAATQPEPAAETEDVDEKQEVEEERREPEILQEPDEVRTQPDAQEEPMELPQVTDASESAEEFPQEAAAPTNGNDEQVGTFDESADERSRVRFLPDMEVRVKDTSDKSVAGQDAIVSRVYDGTCLLRLADGQIMEVAFADLEPFTPDIQQLCKLMIPHECQDAVVMKEYVENDEDNVLIEFPGGQIRTIALDRLCKVSVEDW